MSKFMCTSVGFLLFFFGVIGTAENIYITDGEAKDLSIEKWKKVNEVKGMHISGFNISRENGTDNSTVSIQSAEEKLVGEWEGKDNTGKVASFVFRADKSATMIQGNMVLGSSKGWKFTWELDASHNPMQLDYVLTSASGKVNKLPFIVRFVGEGRLQVRVGEDLSKRPVAFSETKDTNQMILERRKYAKDLSINRTFPLDKKYAYHDFIKDKKRAKSGDVKSQFFVGIVYEHQVGKFVKKTIAKLLNGTKNHRSKDMLVHLIV